MSFVQLLPVLWEGSRGDRYKLLRYRGTEELYDLERDPYEYDNLLTGELSVEEDSICWSGGWSKTGCHCVSGPIWRPFRV